MRIDWDALLPAKAAPNGTESAPEPRRETTEPVTDADLLARQQSGDDRRRCTECGNLGERGLCLAAYRGEIVASRSYAPVRDILRRCEGFAPLPTDPDQRHGRDKWGWLIETRAEAVAVSPAPRISDDAPK